MDAALLTLPLFWKDPACFAAGAFEGGVPDDAELRGHVLFETSGSTGAPKWIALSKEALLTSAVAVNEHLEVTTASCWGLALPPHHVGGFGVAARAFAAGCGFMEFGKRWEPAACQSWLEENAVTHTSLVPTQVHDLVSAGLRAPATLRAVVVGGGHLAVETGAAARALGWPVLASYGMTEAASQIATQPLAVLEQPYQAAPIPLLPIWRADVSPDQTLRIAGPALFSGMLMWENDSWHFKARENEWHETQDRVIFENDCITPLGRADSRVKVLGELVDPEMIERELALLSNGALVPGSFVIATLPDPRAGNVLVPVFDAAVDAALIRMALEKYQQQAPGFLRLRPAVILDPLPRSVLGKPLRAEIVHMIAAME